MKKEVDEASSRKQITFDLHQASLQEYYPKPKFTINKQFFKKAYNDIAKFMRRNGFEREQYSVYTSRKEMTLYETLKLMRKIVKEFPWFANSVSDITVTNVGKIYNLTDMVVEQGKKNRNLFLEKTPQADEKKPNALQDLINAAENEGRKEKQSPVLSQMREKDTR